MRGVSRAETSFNRGDSARLQSHLDGQQKPQREIKQTIARINQFAAGILPPHATAAALSEKGQLRDNCNATSVNEKVSELPEDATTASVSPKLFSLTDTFASNTSPADFLEMLRFLFGE